MSPLTLEFLAALRDSSPEVTWAEVPYESFKELVAEVRRRYPERLPLMAYTPEGLPGLLLFGVPVRAHKEEGWWAIHKKESDEELEGRVEVTKGGEEA